MYQLFPIDTFMVSYYIYGHHSCMSSVIAQHVMNCVLELCFCGPDRDWEQTRCLAVINASPFTPVLYSGRHATAMRKVLPWEYLPCTDNRERSSLGVALTVAEAFYFGCQHLCTKWTCRYVNTSGDEWCCVTRYVLYSMHCRETWNFTEYWPLLSVCGGGVELGRLVFDVTMFDGFCDDWVKWEVSQSHTLPCIFIYFNHSRVQTHLDYDTIVSTPSTNTQLSHVPVSFFSHKLLWNWEVVPSIPDYIRPSHNLLLFNGIVPILKRK